MVYTMNATYGCSSARDILLQLRNHGALTFRTQKHGLRSARYGPNFHRNILLHINTKIKYMLGSAVTLVYRNNFSMLGSSSVQEAPDNSEICVDLIVPHTPLVATALAFR